MRIQLTSWDITGDDQVDWRPNQIVDVTDDNKERAERVLKNGGATRLAVPESSETQAGEADEEEEPDLTGLELADSVDELAEFGINARFPNALKLAEVATIGDVVSRRETLAEVSGVSPAAAEQILKVIDSKLQS